MKVKDAIGVWLLVWNKGNRFPPMTEHYFTTKGKSLCKKVGHPKTQPNAVFIAHKTCSTCLNKKFLLDKVQE